mmetsp:Transcript_27764/g.88119  ORF Transcript_27764/g.88119 Transcript_27764/m.88119 type:complete len:225 (-) Transcript_27764:4378-5052(-)
MASTVSLSPAGCFPSPERAGAGAAAAAAVAWGRFGFATRSSARAIICSVSTSTADVASSMSRMRRLDEASGALGAASAGASGTGSLATALATAAAAAVASGVSIASSGESVVARMRGRSSPALTSGGAGVGALGAAAGGSTCRKARARQSNWIWPAESGAPPFASTVSEPAGSDVTALASCAASSAFHTRSLMGLASPPSPLCPAAKSASCGCTFSVMVRPSKT